MSTRTGHCLCGAVRFDAEEVAKSFSACHCEMCQRWSSGPFFATTVGKVRFTGEENLSRYRSSAWAERGFCKICGSNLFFRILKFPGHDWRDFRRQEAGWIRACRESPAPDRKRDTREIFQSCGVTTGEGQCAGNRDQRYLKAGSTGSK